MLDEKIAEICKKLEFDDEYIKDRTANPDLYADLF